MNKLLTLLFALTSCGGGGAGSSSIKEQPVQSIPWDETTMVEYRYGDSSIAPEYHRSYTISITDDKKTIVIDSYGNVLLRKEYPNTPTEFQAFIEELSKKGIKQHQDDNDDPCDGGTSETLRLYNKDVKFFDAYVYHCSGESGTLTLPAGTARFICSQIPENVDSLINSTIRDDVEDEEELEPEQ